MSKYAPDSPTLPEYACDVCGWNADACECPECLTCGGAGDPACLINGGRGCCLGELPPMPRHRLPSKPPVAPFPAFNTFVILVVILSCALLPRVISWWLR